MNYRINILDHRFQIIQRYDYEGRDDLSALDKANSFSEENPVEVWQRGRLVARMNMGGEAI